MLDLILEYPKTLQNVRGLCPLHPHRGTAPGPCRGHPAPGPQPPLSALIPHPLDKIPAPLPCDVLAYQHLLYLADRTTASGSESTPHSIQATNHHVKANRPMGSLQSCHVMNRCSRDHQSDDLSLETRYILPGR